MSNFGDTISRILTHEMHQSPALIPHWGVNGAPLDPSWVKDDRDEERREIKWRKMEGRGRKGMEWKGEDALYSAMVVSEIISALVIQKCNGWCCQCVPLLTLGQIFSHFIIQHGVRL